MPIKLDVSKSYDRVSWTFLEDILMKMGMDQKMVFLIMTCVKTLTFFVLINEEPHETRGSSFPLFVSFLYKILNLLIKNGYKKYRNRQFEDIEENMRV